MQGKKEYQEKLFANFQLSERIPKGNFYRRLKAELDLDFLFFLGYDIDEPLPWHSNISRTRQLYPEAVFEQVFTKVLTMCVEKGMVSGHTQAIDSAPVKANASMDTLELKVPKEDLEAHLHSIRHISVMDKKNSYKKIQGKQGITRSTRNYSKCKRVTRDYR